MPSSAGFVLHFTGTCTVTSQSVIYDQLKRFLPLRDCLAGIIYDQLIKQFLPLRDCLAGMHFVRLLDMLGGNPRSSQGFVVVFELHVKLGNYRYIPYIYVLATICSFEHRACMAHAKPFTCV